VSNHVDGPRYLFLLRHASQSEGHLTEDGSAHVRGLAVRLSEWIYAAWRARPDRLVDGQSDRTVRLWYAAQVSEVQETADLLTHQVLVEMERLKVPGNYPFVSPAESNQPLAATPALDGRPAWMPTLLPNCASNATDYSRQVEANLGRILSGYSPNEDAFKRLCEWLNSAETDSHRTSRSSSIEGRNRCARRTQFDAPLLVGNDPLIGWLATRLCGRAIPVARGELVCLVQEPRGSRRRPRAGDGIHRSGGSWRLLWTISADGDPEAASIRDKIRSKMTTAAALGTVIVGLTTFLLQDTLQKQQSAWHWSALAAMGVSAALYFASLFLYDGLLMPTRFWANDFPSSRHAENASGLALARLRRGKLSVLRPPSSTARVLQTNMVRIWSWIFTPATVLLGVGVALFAIGATPQGGEHVVRVEVWHALVVIVGLTVVVTAWVASQRPNLGSSD
jgi:hypothetical protein